MIACPVPLDEGATVQLGHGSGGVMMHRLLEQVILPALDGSTTRVRHDGAVLDVGGAMIITADRIQNRASSQSWPRNSSMIAAIPVIIPRTIRAMRTWASRPDDRPLPRRQGTRLRRPPSPRRCGHAGPPPPGPAHPGRTAGVPTPLCGACTQATIATRATRLTRTMRTRTSRPVDRPLPCQWGTRLWRPQPLRRKTLATRTRTSRS